MGTERDPSRPPWPCRLPAVVGYLGLTPLLRLFRVRRDDAYLRHHQAQGLALMVPLIGLLLLWPITQTLQICLVKNRIGPDSFHLVADAVVTVVILGGIALWGLISLAAIGMAVV